MSNREYFGTDGTRGHIGDTPITPDFVLELGWIAGKVFTCHGSRKTIIDKDTRVSGYVLRSMLEAGLATTGLSASPTEPILTPAVAYLMCAFRVRAGTAISASHDPYYDNGIKFFSTSGTKLPDAVEEAAEAEIERTITYVDSAELGKATHIADAVGRYIEFCKGTFPNELSLNKLRIVVNYASGATYHIAPNVLCELGVGVIVIDCESNGMNINEEVSATDVRALQARVIVEKANLGIVLDGDGDRVITVGHKDNKVDGDQIMYTVAREALRQSQLRGGAVGVLIGSMGLELALKQLDIPLVHTKIGDRYALEKMQEKGWCTGAEDSGHVILLDRTTTGDGIVAGLQVLVAVVHGHVSLYDLYSGAEMLPQLLVNARYTAGSDDPLERENVEAVTVGVEAVLDNHERVLLRKSGAEPLTYVMVEGEDETQVTGSIYRTTGAAKAAQFRGE